MSTRKVGEKTNPHCERSEMFSLVVILSTEVPLVPKTATTPNLSDGPYSSTPDHILESGKQGCSAMNEASFDHMPLLDRRHSKFRSRDNNVATERPACHCCRAPPFVRLLLLLFSCRDVLRQVLGWHVSAQPLPLSPIALINHRISHPLQQPLHLMSYPNHFFFGSDVNFH